LCGRQAIEFADCTNAISRGANARRSGRKETQATGQEGQGLLRPPIGSRCIGCLGESLEVAEKIRNQFAARKPDRQYIAIVAGLVEDDSGTIQNYLATDENLNRYSVEDPAKGELAITHYRVRQRWQDTTLVEVRLETGRRNQIRVHMADLGHPILGDPRYRRDLATHRAWPYRRIALHAESLGFVHPTDGQAMRFVAPWPQEFRDFQRGGSKPRQAGSANRKVDTQENRD
jgi:hypothetical protein